MQGQKSAIGSLPETLGFNHGSTSAEAGIEQQICWNNLRNPTQNLIPDYMVSSNETGTAYIGSASQERQNLNGWSLGESSSSIGQNQVSENAPKPEHHWQSPMSAFPVPPCIPEERRYRPSNVLSLNNAEVNINSNHTSGTGLFMQGSSSRTSTHNLNRNSGFEGDDTDDDDDCLVMECVTAYKSEVPVNDERVSSVGTSSIPFGGPSGAAGYLAQESDGRPGSSLDGRRLSCKRKALEGHVGQSSGSGSSNYFNHAESSLWHALPAQHNVSNSPVMPSSAQNYSGVNLPEQVNPRLGLSIGTAVPEDPLGLTSSRNAESSHRNFRLRINTSHQQQDSIPQNLFPSEVDVVNSTISSDRHPSRILNNSLTIQPSPVTYNSNAQGAVRVPSLRPNTQGRWNVASSSRSGSPASFPLSGERDFIMFEEASSRGGPRNVSQHPMFTPASEIGNASQSPANWGLANGNISIGGNVSSTSRGGSSSGAHSASPSWASQRNHPQYPRRLTEYVRRSLLSSVAADSGGVASNNPPPLSGSSAPPQEMALPGSHGHRPSSSRSAMLLERHLGGASGVPYSWRGLAAAGEGRSRLVSEIRNVLDLMRRGENLRIEDVMILDQSILFGMADIHDRHRDMRLDVDNMSYEELLALEERIGNVCTGLSDETIASRLKQQKYAYSTTEDSMETEPCCICQEEYNDGEDLGILDCGHDFHTNCIKQWLKHKNLCPICKTTGLTT